MLSISKICVLSFGLLFLSCQTSETEDIVPEQLNKITIQKVILKEVFFGSYYPPEAYNPFFYKFSFKLIGDNDIIYFTSPLYEKLDYTTRFIVPINKEIKMPLTSIFMTTEVSYFATYSNDKGYTNWTMASHNHSNYDKAILNAALSPEKTATFTMENLNRASFNETNIIRYTLEVTVK